MTEPDATQLRRPDGVTLAVRSSGPPGAPGLVLAHGVGSSARFVSGAFAPVLTAAGWRLVTYDLRGHGASTPLPDPADHTLADHAADLAAVATAVGARVVGGVSLGGLAAVAAVRGGLGVDAVVACLPAWSGRAVAGQGAHAAVAAEVRAVGVRGVIDRFRADTTMQPWLRETLLTDWPGHDEASLAAALVALDGGEAPTIDDVASLPVPLVVVAWPDDPGHPWEVATTWVERAPRASLAPLSLDEVGQDRTRFGAAVLAGLAAVDVRVQQA